MKGRSYILNPTHYGKKVSYNITQRNYQISTQILNLSFTAEATHIQLLENNLNRENCYDRWLKICSFLFKYSNIIGMHSGSKKA